MAEDFVLDKKLYRRFYVGLRNDPRINGISMSAVSLYTLVHLIADDWGNFPRSLGFIREEALPQRDTPMESVASWLRELEAPGPPPLLDGNGATPAATPLSPLILPYEAEGRRLYHIVDFIVVQSAAGNGTRYRRYPRSPWDEQEVARYRETKGIRKKLDETEKIRGPATAPAPVPVPSAAARPDDGGGGRGGDGQGGGLFEPAEVAAAADFEMRGIDVQSAARFRARFTPERIVLAFQVFDQRAALERINNPAGLLNKILCEGGSPPLPRQPRRQTPQRKESAAEKQARELSAQEIIDRELKPFRKGEST